MDTLIQFSVRAYRALLVFYPRAFRQRFGEDVVEAFTDSCRVAAESGARGLIPVWLAALFDLVTSGFAERTIALRAVWARHGTPPHLSGSRGDETPMETLLQDLRYAFRSLTQSPLFVGVAVLTLAFGIGVNTTIFNFVNTVLLRPLPVERPDELVEIYSARPRNDAFYNTSSYLDYRDLRNGNDVLSGLAGHTKMIANLAHEGRSEFVVGEIVTGNYFEVLGVPAFVGRTLEAADDRPGESAPVVVLGHGFWRKRFGDDPQVLGKTLRLGGVSYTVVGVAPESFGGTVPGLSSDLWVAAARVADVEPAGQNLNQGARQGKSRLEHRGYRWMFLKGRLKPGVSLEQAESRLQALAAGLAAEYPETNEGREVQLVRTSSVRLHPSLDQALAPAASVLMGAVGLVLLIACANLANMLLSRATSRQREIAIRLALGAERARLVRQLLTESLLLSILGGALALLMATWTTRLILAYQPPMPFSVSVDLQIDGRVVIFNVAVSLLAALAFGLLPALQASRPDLVPALKEGISGAQGPERRFGLRQVLVVVQVAISLVLLVAAGLLGRSFMTANAMDVGFDHDQVAAVWMHPGALGYDLEKSEGIYRRILERVRALRGVESAALADRVPMSLNDNWTRVVVEGHSRSDEDPSFLIDSASVEPGYFATLGIPLVHGHDFDSGDTEEKPRVLIVTEAFAERFWDRTNVVGERVHLGSPEGPEAEIVGVVSDHKVNSVGEEPTALAHFARQQKLHPSANLAVRAAAGTDVVSLLPALRRAILDVEPQMPIAAASTMTERMAIRLYPVQMGALLLSVFGILALLLASIGLYGVIAYSVSRRDREIGLRLALGARPGNVLTLIIRQGMALVLVGVAVGLVVAAAASRALSGVLYGVSAFDPIAFGAAAVVLLSVAFVANYLPASRASRLDPLAALHQE